MVFQAAQLDNERMKAVAPTPGVELRENYRVRRSLPHWKQHIIPVHNISYIKRKYFSINFEYPMK